MKSPASRPHTARHQRPSALSQLPPSSCHLASPEQQARKSIDALLGAAGWTIQNIASLNLHASRGVAVREMQSHGGPADYILFVDRKALGVVEAKKEGTTLSAVAEQSARYPPPRTGSPSAGPIPCPSPTSPPASKPSSATSAIRDSRSRRVFAFHRPETLAELVQQPDTLRARLRQFPALIRRPRLRDCQIEAITSLEESFAANRPRALIQMATGAGKTFTAVHLHLPPHQVRRGQARPLPRGPRQSRPAGHATSSSSSSRPTPAASSPSSTTSSTSPRRASTPSAASPSAPSSASTPCSARRGTSTRTPTSTPATKLAGASPTTDPRRRLQSRDPHRDLRLHRHRRMPPLHLQPLAAGARILRRLPHRPHRHALASRPSASSTRTSSRNTTTSAPSPMA